MKHLKIILALALAITVTTGASAEDFTKVGTAGAQFLKVGVGARYTAMGEASVATTRDAYAMYWNPAALGMLNNSSLEFTNINYIAGVDLNYLAYAQPTTFGTIGVSVTALSSGDIEVTTVDQPNGTGSFYSVSSYALGLGFARQLTDFFSFGIVAKYVAERISEETSSGVAFDFGTLLRPQGSNFRVGINIANLGPELKLSGPELNFGYNPSQGNDGYDNAKGVLSVDSYDLPLLFRIGVAYDYFHSDQMRVTFSAEARDPSDNRQQGSIGTEFAFQERFFLRGGWKFNYEEQNLSLGGGLNVDVWTGTTLSLNYAWADYGRLSDVHRFSVGFQF